MNETILVDKNLSLEEKYESLIPQIKNLLSPSDNIITNLANCTAALRQAFEKISWVGFYIFDGKELYLGPFQGKVACNVIQIGNGVCGTAAERKETIIVPDVNKFPGHIFCDADSISEIVVPVFKKDNSLFGVLDIDSYDYDSFNETDKKYLEEICNFLTSEII
jgi:L-methionine (R)-S-oxide reductase